MATTTIPSLIAAVEQGDQSAVEPLFAALYKELHRLAQQELSRRGSAFVGVSPTTILHEAYVNIAPGSNLVFPDRARFMSYASRVMRGLIIDHARNRQAPKRGGQFEITSLRTDIVEKLAEGRELSVSEAAVDERRRAGAGRSRRPEILLWLLVCRDRRDARRVRAHDPAPVGEIAHLSVPEIRRQST